MPVGPFRTFTHGVNVSSLAARFEAGAEVTPETLLAARVLRTLRHPVKILGDGEIGVALTVHAHRFSASARQKIEAAGGTVVLIDPVEEPGGPRARRGQARRLPRRGPRRPRRRPRRSPPTTTTRTWPRTQPTSAKRPRGRPRRPGPQPLRRRSRTRTRTRRRPSREPADDAEEPVAESDEPAADESAEGDEA